MAVSARTDAKEREPALEGRIPAEGCMNENPDFSRTLVVGNSGSGKSWLSVQRAKAIGTHAIDLDTIHWETTRSDMHPLSSSFGRGVKVRRAFMAGNYRHVS